MNINIKQLLLTVTILVVVSLLRINASNTKYRLNTAIYPSAYTIQITPYFDTGDSRFTFDGEVNIALSTEKNGIRRIKLHSASQTFSSEHVSIHSDSGPIQVWSIVFDPHYEFVHMHLTSELVANTTYYLHISYRGQIAEDLKGFYRSSYLENDVVKWLGVTQFQPTYARRVFPCFDEPAYKATFVVIIDRPETYQPSLSNTKLQITKKLHNGRVRETFYPTPRMSTYLLAFLVSEFKSGNYSADNGRELGIWARPEVANQTAWAMDIGTRIINSLRDFTGIDYYSTNDHLKLDHVALPDFEAYGMENWGLVNYGEDYLLYHPEESSVIDKQEVAVTVAHESAHLWFGDLVTCHWWSDVWLNEGFASYVQVEMINLVEPSLGLEDQVISDTLRQAFAEDEKLFNSAMTDENVNSHREIELHFDAISYSKASSVIKMIQHWIGMDAFKYGLRSYLKEKAFDVSKPEHLYKQLQSGVDFYNSLASLPHHSVADVMNSWVTTPGYPIVHVHIDFRTNKITLTQKRYNIWHKMISFNATYSIPISYTTENIHDFQNTTPAFIFDERSHSFIDENLEDGWVIFNIQYTGYYRVNYNTQLWYKIAKALKGNTRTNIHRINRGQIVDDLFALAKVNYVSYDTVFHVLQFLAEETEYAPWDSAILGFSNLRETLSEKDPGYLGTLDDYLLDLLTKVLEKVGFEETPTETDLMKLHRMKILTFACSLGHKECVRRALGLFDGLRDNNTPIPPNLRPFVYCTVFKMDRNEDVQFLMDRKETNNVSKQEQKHIAEAETCAGDVEDDLSFLRPLKKIIHKKSTEHLLINLESSISSCTECPTRIKQAIINTIDDIRHNFRCTKNI